MLRRLFEMDLRHVLARVYAHCSPRDLCAVAQVGGLVMVELVMLVLVLLLFPLLMLPPR